MFYSIYRLYKIYKKSNKSNSSIPYKDDKHNENNQKDPFILSFRKTRIETLIIYKVEEISKSRDIQFVVSSYYYSNYSNDKSIKGCIYIITSKILYKLFFVKQSLITKEIHTFNTFISVSNKNLYNSILTYLDTHSLKQRHHNHYNQ